MYQFEVTAVLLVALFGGALALAFDYFPGLAHWFDGLTIEAKRILNVIGVTGFAVILFLGQCFGIFLTNLVCSWQGGFDLLYLVFLAITVNQGVHLGFKPTAAFKARIGAESNKN
jgi:hypothetical protein